MALPRFLLYNKRIKNNYLYSSNFASRIILNILLTTLKLHIPSQSLPLLLNQI